MKSRVYIEKYFATNKNYIDMRRTGETTRRIDEAVQNLFTKGEIFVPDYAWVKNRKNSGICIHEETSIEVDHFYSSIGAQDFFLKRIMNRLNLEHQGQVEADGRTIRLKVSKDGFIKRFFRNNFYWVDEDNYKTLQEISLEIGCLCHTGEKEIIEWHKGFNNLGFRTRGNQIYFQKEPFLTNRESSTSYQNMLVYYKQLKKQKKL